MTGETHRSVGRRAETGRDVQPRVRAVAGQPAGTFAVESAVGDERAEPRHPQLTTVCVAGEHQAKAVGDVAIEHPRFRGVRETERNHGVRINSACDALVVVRLDVRITHATELDALTGDLDRRTTMREVEP